MIIPQRHDLQLTLHSYFESEGDQNRKITVPPNAHYEDNLPIWIRELKGAVMRAGEQQNVRILPSMWSSRKRHVDVKFVDGSIQKENGGTIKTDAGEFDTWKWSWRVGSRTEAYWVEKAYPRRIIRFSSSDGTQGELLHTLRAPYWGLNDNSHTTWRDKLKIPR